MKRAERERTHSAIDNVEWGLLNTVMDGNGPELHKHEEAKVGELLEGEDEDEDVVGEGLEPAIKRVEGEGGEGKSASGL